MADTTRKSPGSATNTTRAKSKTSNDKISHVAREILGALLAALIFAATMWSSVFGMSGQFGPTSDVGFTLAGMVADDR